ncbi:MAG: dihydroneopterin aldolase [Planctomycetota bacterium]|nr:dihydroneopterin aldolase [Planctomycetota bacterium]
MDRIIIEDLAARCIIGIDADERREKQDVVINIVLETDLRAAGKSDRFENAVDYRGIKKKVLAMVEGSQYFLIEALAERVAEICLENPKVKRVVVRVGKPSALRFARSVGVEIARGRSEANGES